jgi:hypothetical protein
MDGSDMPKGSASIAGGARLGGVGLKGAYSNRKATPPPEMWIDGVLRPARARNIVGFFYSDLHRPGSKAPQIA